MSETIYSPADSQAYALGVVANNISILFEMLGVSAAITDSAEFAALETDLKSGKCLIRAEADLDPGGLLSFKFSAIREGKKPQTIFKITPKRTKN